MDAIDETLAAAANVLQVIDAFAELGLVLDARKLRDGPNCKTLAAAVQRWQEGKGGRRKAEGESEVTAPPFLIEHEDRRLEIVTPGFSGRAESERCEP